MSEKWAHVCVKVYLAIMVYLFCRALCLILEIRSWCKKFQNIVPIEKTSLGRPRSPIVQADCVKTGCARLEVPAKTNGSMFPLLWNHKMLNWINLAEDEQMKPVVVFGCWFQMTKMSPNALAGACLFVTFMKVQWFVFLDADWSSLLQQLLPKGAQKRQYENRCLDPFLCALMRNDDQPNANKCCEWRPTGLSLTNHGWGLSTEFCSRLSILQTTRISANANSESSMQPGCQEANSFKHCSTSETTDI